MRLDNKSLVIAKPAYPITLRKGQGAAVGSTDDVCARVRTRSRPWPKIRI